MNGAQLKAEGMAQVAGNNAEFLKLVRQRARAYCKTFGKVSIDNLRAWYVEECTLHPGTPVPSSPNAWGAVFHSREWQVVEYKPSRYLSNHARRVAVWRWVGRES